MIITAVYRVIQIISGKFIGVFGVTMLFMMYPVIPAYEEIDE